MTTTFSHFSAEEILQQDEQHVLYRLHIHNGKGTARVYPVMPGIEVVELELQAARYVPILHEQQDMIELSHCHSGRAEFRMDDGCSQYIGEGDLFMSTLHNHSDCIDLPLGYYRGITVMIDPHEAAAEAEPLLSGIQFNMRSLSERFFAEDECFLIQASAELSGIFSGMYAAPPEARQVLYRLKVLELLIYLHCFDPKDEPQRPVYARQQVELIKQIHCQLTGNPAERPTIDELAQINCISATGIKNGFKAVYGTSIYAYMKDYRIRKAAQLLRSTQKSVAEIAAEMGYASPSKFSAAFKQHMKLNPLEYKKKCQTGV